MCLEILPKFTVSLPLDRIIALQWGQAFSLDMMETQCNFPGLFLGGVRLDTHKRVLCEQLEVPGRAADTAACRGQRRLETGTQTLNLTDWNERWASRRSWQG